MAHHIYTTDAFVLESTLSGEADKFFTLFTRDLGLVRATARGVRLERSKLRYNLQDFSQSLISLVRGKDVWRITNARLLDNLYARYREHKDILIVIAHIFSLIKRLVGEEEKNEALFSILSDAWTFLQSAKLHNDALKHFEIIIVLKILDNLGYMAERPALKQFISGSWSADLIASLASHKAEALKEINISLRETQL